MCLDTTELIKRYETDRKIRIKELKLFIFKFNKKHWHRQNIASTLNMK